MKMNSVTTYLRLEGGGVFALSIGADHLLGYGLKRPTAFRDTHLSQQQPDKVVPA